MQEFEYDLTAGFEYAHDGDMLEANHILLKAPTADHSRFTSKLKQGFYQALAEFQASVQSPAEDVAKAQKDASEEEDKESDELKGEDIVQVIMVSSKVDYGAYIDCFKKFLCKGIAFIDGKEIFKEGLFKDMSEKDLTAIMEQYLENFLIAS